MNIILEVRLKKSCFTLQWLNGLFFLNVISALPGKEKKNTHMSHKVWKNNFIGHREGDASKIVESSRFEQISLFLKLQMFNGDESNLGQYFEI